MVNEERGSKIEAAKKKKKPAYKQRRKEHEYIDKHNSKQGPRQHSWMKVEELVIDGFKSYATRTVISGWDPQFNAITGLNGSGKSNVLDAICFVLGIASMSTVRASSLQDLIYKRGQAGVTKASVTIVFDNSEQGKSPIGFESCSKISVTRQIVLGGSSKYLVNGHKAQQQTVLNLLQSVQLNINNPNFLIMQGRITKVLNMKPTEILALVEEAAGTRTFEERKDKAKKTMAKKEAKLTEIRTLQREEIEPKLEKFRNEKRLFLEFQQIQSDLENASRVVAAHDYRRYLKGYSDHSRILNEKESLMTNMQEKVERLSTEIASLHEDLENVKKQRGSELKKDGKIKELEDAENRYSEELTRLNTTKDISTDNLAQEKKTITRLQSQVLDLDSGIANKEDHFRNQLKRYLKLKEELSEAKSELSRKEELLSTLSTGFTHRGDTGGGYAAQLKETKDQLGKTKNSIQQAKLKIDHLEKQMKSNAVKVEEATLANKSVIDDIESRKKKLQAKESELLKHGFDADTLESLRKQKYKIESDIFGLNKQIEYMRRELVNVNFNYSKPHPQFDSGAVKGVAAELFVLDEKNLDKALSLQVCAGSRLYNVIVENSEAASQILERGGLRKRVTFIPLDKIQSRSIDSNVVDLAKSLCPDNVELALNLIKFDSSLLKAMQYIFGSTLICETPEAAKAVTFNPKIRSRSITVEGDVYDPEGNLSGGSRRNNSTILLTIQKYNLMLQRVKNYESELLKTQKQLNDLEKINATTLVLRNDIELGNHELSLLMKKFDNNSSSLVIKENEECKKEIQCLRERIQNDETVSANLEKKISLIEKDIKEFSSDRGTKLRQLEAEIHKLRDEVEKKVQINEEQYASFQELQLVLEQDHTELSNLRNELSDSQKVSDSLFKDLDCTNTKIQNVSTDLEAIKTELDDEKTKVLGLSEEMNELTGVLQSKNDILNETKLSMQKLKHEIEKSSSTTDHLKQKLDLIIKEQEWVVDDNVLNSIFQKYPSIDSTGYHNQIEILKDRYQNMNRKVNRNIMSMIDNMEKKEASLKHMIRTIERDKSKIENTVEKLNGYKRNTLNTTYQEVSLDFGNIFSELLPGAFAKLVPLNENDVTQGLEFKVRLGEVWKQSLVELSGGQRSLIALSLIMALLQFKPAPMYILDEVDAALDLSHTQNIGQLIKTRFHDAQFIIVSLKEGMFSNANRVFRARFQDGTSVVTAM